MNQLRTNRHAATVVKILAVAILLLCPAGALQAQIKKVQANGISLAYESMGPATGEVIMLIGGTGMQLSSWPMAFCHELVGRGFRVVRFDQRDSGHSTKFDAAGEPNWPALIDALMQGKPAPLAYTADDMALDVIGLMDVLAIQKAHLVGISGGGIIAQMVAARFPHRCRSLTSLMATSGNPALPAMKAELQSLLLSELPPPPGDTLAIVARQLKILKAMGSPAYPTPDSLLQAQVRRDIQRCYYPAGEARQGAAAMAAGDRRLELQRIVAPTVVLHGNEDPLVRPEAGRDVAAQIPHAELRLVPGLGHDMPLQLVKLFADAVQTAATGKISAPKKEK